MFCHTSWGGRWLFAQSFNYAEPVLIEVHISARHRMVLKKCTGKGSTAELARYLLKVKLG